MPSVCVFYELTGLPCPACGMTRSFVCFAHGHVADALHWNLLGPPLWLLLAFLLIRSLLTLTLRRPIFSVQLTTINRLSWAGISVLAMFGIARIILLTINHQKF